MACMLCGLSVVNYTGIFAKSYFQLGKVLVIPLIALEEYSIIHEKRQVFQAVIVYIYFTLYLFLYLD